MTTIKELPSDLGKLIVVQKYSGKHLEKPVAAVNVRVDIFGTMWLEVNSENPQLFVGHRIEEWVSGYVSAEKVGKFIPGVTTASPAEEYLAPYEVLAIGVEK